MKKSLKRIGALALVLCLVLALSVTVFAADMGSSGTAGSTTTSAGNTITIKKGLTVSNMSGYGAYEPTITYTYRLSGVTPTTGAKITDNQTPAVTVTVKAGDASYLSTDAVQTATYSSATQVSSGTDCTRDLSWTFNPAAFPSAGVYRFKITEETSVAPASIGIDRPSGYDTEKFLDVYVKNGTSGLEIYGYALLTENAAEVNKDTVKSAGWDSGNDTDSYTTYNITITKEITGAGADMTAEFPFTVTLAGEMGAANIATAGTGTSISTFAMASGVTNAATVTGSLGNGKTLIINGLPKTVSFTVNETNNTADQYTATASVSNITGTTNSNGAALAASANLDVVTGGAIANASDAIEITVTNNLDLISPTGVVLRFAPFFFLLAGGIVLLALSRRRRADEEA